MPPEMKNSLCTTRGFTSFNASSEMQNHSFLQHLDMSLEEEKNYSKENTVCRVL
jgi:hypothetical protein